MTEFLKTAEGFDTYAKKREGVYNFLLFCHIFVCVVNVSSLERWPRADFFSRASMVLEGYGFPLVLAGLYVANLFCDKTYWDAKTEIVKLFMFFGFAYVSGWHYSAFGVGAFLLCADFSSIRKISLTASLAITISTLWMILLSLMGCIPDFTIEHMGRLSHSFGFPHYAFWARQLLFAALFYFVWRAGKVLWAELAAFLALQAVVFYYSTQRLTFIISIMAVVVMAVFVKKSLVRVDSWLIKGLCLTAYPLATALTIVASLFYNGTSALHLKINDMLNTRLHLQHIAFILLDVQLGPQFVHGTTDFYFYVDNGLLYIIFAYGLVMAGAVLACYSFILWQSCTKKYTAVFSLMLMCLVYLLVDNPVCEMSCVGTAMLYMPILLKERLASYTQKVEQKRKNTGPKGLSQ